MDQDVYQFITTETTNFKTRGVPLDDQWEWSMFEHIKRSFLYKHSKFWKGENDGSRPFKNIVRPILNVAYRSEGFDVKDITPFVNELKNYYKSFLVKKFHPKWARKNDLDTFIDELVESYVDYGLALVKNVNEVRPEVVNLKTIAFCDQTNILAGPLCILHPYEPSELIAMKGKWNEDAIDLAIQKADTAKTVLAAGDKKAETPGKHIEVYELHIDAPETWLNKDKPEDADSAAAYEPEYTDSTKYVKQLHIVGFYQNEKNGKKEGVCFFRGPEKKPVFKALKRDDIFGRACGWGGVEELFEPQTWTNKSEIEIAEMLEVASMMILQTADENLAQKNVLTDLEKGQILEHEENKPVSQLVIQPFNKAQFDQKVQEWEQNAMMLGSASEGALGKNPSAGTPFALQDLIVQQGQGMHEYRQGKISTFVSELYRDWILQFLVDDMNAGQAFIEELSLDELNAIVDTVVENQINKVIMTDMLKPGKDAKVMTPEGRDLLRQTKREEFMKVGQKRFLEIMKDELRDIPVDVEMNIAGKQKDLAGAAAKLTNVFRAIIADPSILQQPGMGDLFNQILEASGFSPINFASFTKPQPAQAAAPAKGGSQAAVPTTVSPTEEEAALNA